MEPGQHDRHVTNVEGFVRDLFGLKTFEFDGEQAVPRVLDARRGPRGRRDGLNVTLAVLFNLISDLLGGVRVTVLEEEVVLRRAPTAAAAPSSSAAADAATDQRRLTGSRSPPSTTDAGYRRAAPGAIAQSVRAHP